MKKIAIIGSTGSIGTQALDVVRKHPDKLKLVALAAGRNVGLLTEQVREFKPDYAAIDFEGAYSQLSRDCDCWTGQGIEAIASLAALEEIDLALIAVSGAAGIWSAYQAAGCGKTIGLANKESLVAAGSLIMPLAAAKGAVLLPVDSEHSAIFQCLQGDKRTVRKIWLTASGGPFRGHSQASMASVTREQALRHPKWSMGAKITVDSATLMNKGLEVIEAHHLFGISYDNIDVVVHPQSVIHSMVEYVDGAVLGHLGVPDMRIPIQYAFSYPDRWESPAPRLDLLQLARLDFEAPNRADFPALDLAYAAGRRGGTMPAVMNGANEAAVDSFLKDEIGFLDIAAAVEKVMARHSVIDEPNLKEIMDSDLWARQACRSVLKQGGKQL